jgi:hypothetical protein
LLGPWKCLVVLPVPIALLPLIEAKACRSSSAVGMFWCFRCWELIENGECAVQRSLSPPAQHLKERQSPTS